MTTRVLPSATTVRTSKAVRTPRGTTYTPTAGTSQDVPDHDAVFLEANGWINLGLVGTTALRPTTGLRPGLIYNDTTVGAVIVYDGTTWRNAYSGASA